MAELENEKERERVPVAVPKHEQKVEQEQFKQTQEPGEQSVVPRRWHVY